MLVLYEVSKERRPIKTLEAMRKACMSTFAIGGLNTIAYIAKLINE